MTVEDVGRRGTAGERMEQRRRKWEGKEWWEMRWSEGGERGKMKKGGRGSGNWIV